MTGQFHSIIGLVGSGKTTFLAALWHLLDGGEVTTKLQLHQLTGDHHYLNEIVETWRRCEKSQRTSMGAETTVTMQVKEMEQNNNATILFPDLSGETFENQFSTRKCKQNYIDTSNQADGILLFITADRPIDGISIIDMQPVLGGNEEAGQSSGSIGWEPKLAPTQVKIVELLQFLLQPPFQRRLRRLAIIISAWDVVQGTSILPSYWLAREFPLLDQFLRSNTDCFESRVYGVSAQGGDWAGSEKSDLLDLPPSKRIECIGDQTDQHDITSPIVWLMRGS